MSRQMLDYRPGETVGQHYNRLVEHARKLDPRFVGGVASVPELARVEQAIATLSKQAEEKARRERDNDPLVRANAGLNELWRRAHRAQQEIAEAQAKLGSSLYGSFTLRHELTDLKMLNPPPEWFEAPPDIGGAPPNAKTLEEADLLEADLSVVIERNERTRAGLTDLLSWADASLEQQNRRLIRALWKKAGG
jgi:hypothetical protein